MSKLKNPHRNKARGNQTENEIAKKMTELLRESEHMTDDEQFYRTDGSGARRTQRQKVPYEVLLSYVGDIYGPIKFPFVIECKGRRGDPDFHLILDGKKHEIFDWIEQNEADAEEVSKESLLIIKYARRGFFVCLPSAIFKDWLTPGHKYNVLSFRASDRNWALMTWTDFAEMVTIDYDGWLKERMTKC